MLTDIVFEEGEVLIEMLIGTGTQNDADDICSSGPVLLETPTEEQIYGFVNS